MKEFTADDDLRGARFTGTNLSGACLREVDLTGARVIGALLMDADISGDISGLKVNGIEVAPLVEAELTRLYPERAKLFASHPDGVREAWSTIEGLWDRTVERARRLPQTRLHERVAEEWSFVETLRHLVFVTDAWVSRPVLGAANHYHPLGLLHTPMDSSWISALDLAPDPTPTLEEVLEARRSRMKVVRDIVAELTPAELARMCAANPAPGYPENTATYAVWFCLRVVINEEWEHHRFATRDLEQLERE
jgi:uncharacterized protein YjbI with pentapeptide repeats